MNEIETVAAGPKRARVEIIPLIDVIFFLLATFVLFTLSLQRVKVLEAELPQGIAEKPGIDDTMVFIQASADGTFYWKLGSDGMSEPIALPELAPKLASYKASVLVPRVLVRSDGKAKLGLAVAVLDEVRRAGIRQVAVETRVSAAGS